MSVILPIVTIQHDFQSVVSDVQDGIAGEEDIWISCYKIGEASTHGKSRVSLGEKGVDGNREIEFRSRDGVLFEREGKSNYFVSCLALAINRTRIRLPRKTLRDTDNTQQITAFSVSPDLNQVAIGRSDGTIRRHSNRNSDVTVQPLTYSPHLSGTSITTLRYFPSSRVLLSGGSDFTLHILDADPDVSQTSTPKPARSLKGHVRSVTDTAIIGKGRNVLSSAKDGTIRLWDVGSGSQIRMLGSQKYAAINALSLGDESQGLSTLNAETQLHPPDAREAETDGKLVFAGLQDGNFECFDLSSKTPVYHSSSSPTYRTTGALTAVSLSPDNLLLATGSTKGLTTIYDVRNLQVPLSSFRRNNASIEDLTFLSSESVAVVTEDGLPFVVRVRQSCPEILAELAGGSDCDAVRAVQVDSNGGIWIGGDDGVLRMY